MPGHNISVPDAGTDSASHFGEHHPQATTVNLRNPLPLSAAQEAQVKAAYFKRVRDICSPEIQEFAKCAKGRTVSATWTCRQERFKMNGCMIAHAKPEVEDEAREEWFRGIQERRREREAKAVEVEKRRKEVIDLTKKKVEEEKQEAEAQAKAKSEEGKKKAWW